VRFVYRSTRIYFLLQQQLLDAAHLGDGADWSIGLEVLSRAVMPQSQQAREAGAPSVFWPVVLAEREALERGDIPYFVAAAGSRHLPLISGPVECFVSSCLEWAVQRLQTMDDADMRRQLALIQGTIYSHMARGTEPLPASSEPDPVEPEGTPGSREDLVAAALSIAAEIRERAVLDPDGSLAWIVPHYLIQAERYQLQPSGPELYDGAAGIAIFFAALERVTGGGYRDLALGTLQPLRRELQQYGDRAARHSSIGGASGLGSMVYAFVAVARFLDAFDLLSDAHAVARLITDERISNDRSLDVIQGSAGAILGLLSLYEVDPDRRLLDAALRTGEHLLQSRQESAAGPRAWPTVGEKLLTGFSHGAAGIAYALLRLYRATGDGAFLQAAEEGVAYEDIVFDSDEGNWPDFRNDPPAFMSAWCHGAAGIGLARLAGLETLDSEQIRRDLDQALIATETQRLDRHIACCGAMGRVELLLSAGLQLEKPQLVAGAHSLASRVLRQRRQRGTYYVHPHLPAAVYNPSLFQGTAGIGYQLLRLADPSLVPAFLVWE
jgi:type 2 lantibiotic biosynthesis protein LanM